MDHLGVYRKFEEKSISTECKTIEIFNLYFGRRSTAQLDFRGPDGDGIGTAENKEFVARRVMRWQLQECLLERVHETEGIEVVFGRKVTQISETDYDDDKAVHLTFEDGTKATGDILLGCDGIHSAARDLLVEPTRRPTYTGNNAAISSLPLCCARIFHATSKSLKLLSTTDKSVVDDSGLIQGRIDEHHGIRLLIVIKTNVRLHEAWLGLV